MKPRPLDLRRLRVHPLAERKTLLRVDDILLDPDSPAPLISDIAQAAIREDADGFPHRWKPASMLAEASRLDVPATVHPGIGYDIIACHPMFDGALLGQAAALDFAQVAGAVDALDGGVVLVIGSAIMAP